MKHAILIAVLAAACSSDGPDDVVGGACRDDLDCAERCEDGGEFPDGFCTLSCLDDRDCDNGSLCTDMRGGICLFPCARNNECDFLGPRYGCHERRDWASRTVFVCLGN